MSAVKPFEVPKHERLPNGIWIQKVELAREHLMAIRSLTPEPKPYVPRDSEPLVFEFCLENGYPFMVVGPPGCGKTTLVEFMAHMNKRPVATVQFDKDASVASHRGTKDIYTDEAGGKHMVFVDGPVTNAVRSGEAVIYLDEVNYGEDFSFYHPITDHRRVLVNKITNEVLPLGDRVMVAASYNPGLLFTGTELNPAFARRFVTLRLDYLNEDEEVKIALEGKGDKECVSREELVKLFSSKMVDGKAQMERNKAKVTGRMREIATGLVKGVNEIRKSAREGGVTIKEEPNAGALKVAREMIAAGFGYATAITSAIINPILRDLDAKWRATQKALFQTIKGHMPRRLDLEDKYEDEINRRP